MKSNFASLLQQEIERIDASGTAKRHEKIIDGFTGDPSPKAIINGEEYYVFNSNDYLGLRFHPNLREAEHDASEQYGSGPGAVRFISGTHKIYKDLEKALAAFHGRDDAMIFSSAFAANLAVIACFLRGQSKDSLVSDSVVVISDELNHRSIIDGVRVASIEKEQKKIFKHMDYDNLKQVLEENKNTYDRAVVITDGVFSMIGEVADVAKLREIVDSFNDAYKEGVILIVDDSHGVAAFGDTGRGTEEVSKGKADLLVGTLGKGFGADGGYVVADNPLIAYLRESAATYIYSNSVSPSVAGAGFASVQLMSGEEGKALLTKLKENLAFFKERIKEAGFAFAADSNHPIQPLLIGDPQKTKTLRDQLFADHILVTNINYPVVAKGKDEIRVQINASHTKEDIEYFVSRCVAAGKTLGIIG